MPVQLLLTVGLQKEPSDCPDMTWYKQETINRMTRAEMLPLSHQNLTMVSTLES